jgi:DNA-binding transcriptional regulator YiaG
MDRTALTDAQLKTLYEEKGLSQGEIAHRMGISKRTLNARMKALGLTRKPAPATSTPDVHMDTLTPPQIAALPELLDWWQRRQETRAAATEGERQTERVTFHVEKRWIEAIRRQADLDHATITQIVNRAFQAFFTDRHT